MKLMQNEINVVISGPVGVKEVLWSALNHITDYCVVQYIIILLIALKCRFVAFILVSFVFCYAIFRLTDFSSDVFDFSSSNT